MSSFGIDNKREPIMRKFAIPCTILGAILALPFYAGSAQAQASRTWVSGVGDDANPCSRTAPCKTFAGAISKTATDGEINCLDPGGFGAVTITKNMTINCEETLGSVLVSGTNAIIISPPAGQTLKVTLKGIELEGLGTGINGVSITANGVILHMHKIQIRKFANNGINFAPSLGSELYVSEAYISDSGTNAGAAGIAIVPSAGAAVGGAYENVKLENNGTGFIANGNTSGNQSHVLKNVSAVGNNSLGIGTNSTTNNINLMLNMINASNNQTGVQMGGGTGRIGDSVVTGNGTGVAIVSGTLTSYKNNQINGNTGGEPNLTQVVFD